MYKILYLSQILCDVFNTQKIGKDSSSEFKLSRKSNYFNNCNLTDSARKYFNEVFKIAFSEEKIYYRSTSSKQDELIDKTILADKLNRHIKKYYDIDLQEQLIDEFCEDEIEIEIYYNRLCDIVCKIISKELFCGCGTDEMNFEFVKNKINEYIIYITKDKHNDECNEEFIHEKVDFKNSSLHPRIAEMFKRAGYKLDKNNRLKR